MTIDIQVELNEVRCNFCGDRFTQLLGTVPQKDYYQQWPERMTIMRKSARGAYKPVYGLDSDIGPARLWEKAQAQGWTEIIVYDDKMLACPTCQKKKVQL